MNVVVLSGGVGSSTAHAIGSRTELNPHAAMLAGAWGGGGMYPRHPVCRCSAASAYPEPLERLPTLIDSNRMGRSCSSRITVPQVCSHPPIGVALPSPDERSGSGHPTAPGWTVAPGIGGGMAPFVAVGPQLSVNLFPGRRDQCRRPGSVL